MKLKMFNFSASICQIPEQKPWKEDTVPPQDLMKEVWVLKFICLSRSLYGSSINEDEYKDTKPHNQRKTRTSNKYGIQDWFSWFFLNMS